MPATDLIKFPIQDAAIAELSAKYMPLTVAGINDQQGLAAVRDARLEVKRLRVDVEKKRVELKADALEYGRKVDAEAKRITALLAPIETHLETQEGIVAKEKARIKAEEDAKKQAKLQARLDALTKCETFANQAAVEAMSDEQFALFLEKAQEAHSKKLADEAAHRARQKAEEERLAAERAELAKQREAAEAEARKLREEAEAKAAAEREELAKAKAAQEAENKRIRDEQEAERRRLEAERNRLELEKARAEAAEKARKDTEARIAREKAEAEERARQEKIEAERREQEREAARLRAEALRPDREKLLAVAEQVKAIEVPLVGDEAHETAVRIEELLDDCHGAILEAVAELNIEVQEPAAA